MLKVFKIKAVVPGQGLAEPGIAYYESAKTGFKYSMSNKNFPIAAYFKLNSSHYEDFAKLIEYKVNF